MTRKRKPSTYQLRITLRRSRPRIWRRVLVPADYSLVGLHQTIQLAMGWEDQHLHAFAKYGGRSRYPPRDTVIEDAEEEYVGVDDVFSEPGGRIQYHYDFGNGWLHDVTLEKILPEVNDRIHPVCIDGRNACPPENIGGIDRYLYLLEGLNDPDHPAFGELTEWYGGEFDPTDFIPDVPNSLYERYA